jgi:hypothetical protein
MCCHGRRRIRSLVRLLPQLASVRVYDNSVEADPAQGLTPALRRVLCVERKIVAPTTLRPLVADTPAWAKPIVAAALDLFGGQVSCAKIACIHRCWRRRRNSHE